MPVVGNLPQSLTFFLEIEGLAYSRNLPKTPQVEPRRQIILPVWSSSATQCIGAFLKQQFPPWPLLRSSRYMGLKWTLAVMTRPGLWSPRPFTGGNGRRGRVRGPRYRPQIGVAGAVCVAYNVRAAISRGPATADPSSYYLLALLYYIYVIT
jgi:hypothetical protein